MIRHTSHALHLLSIVSSSAASPRDRILARCASAWLRALAAGARPAICLEALDALSRCIGILAGQSPPSPSPASPPRIPTLSALIERQLHLALDLGEDGAEAWSELMAARQEALGHG